MQVESDFMGSLTEDLEERRYCRNTLCKVKLCCAFCERRDCGAGCTLSWQTCKWRCNIWEMLLDL